MTVILVSGKILSFSGNFNVTHHHEMWGRESWMCGGGGDGGRGRCPGRSI